MNIKESFLNLIDSIEEKINSVEEKANACVSFLNDIDINEINKYFANSLKKNLEDYVAITYIGPPAVIPIARYRDYVLELTYWYPLELSFEKNDYDPEDIHDHFGYLVTKMLKGEGYEETVYKKNNEIVTIDRISKLVEGQSNIISSEYIHSIVYKSPKPSISIRIFLPNTKGTMNIYDKQTGKLDYKLIAPNEKRKYEFAGFLSFLNSDQFKNEIVEIKRSSLLDKIKQQLDILVNLK